jgi:hypothetical protein
LGCDSDDEIAASITALRQAWCSAAQASTSAELRMSN